MDEQIKASLQKIKESWIHLAPKRKKLILAGAGIFVLFSLGLVLFLNFNNAGMTPLYDSLGATESMEVYNALLEQGIPAQLSGTGAVEVRRADKDRAVAQMAMQNLPKSVPPYNYFGGTSGLMTTDMEKRQMVKQDLQDRLQGTILQYDGVKNVVVTIDLPADNNFPWSTETQQSTASVSLVLENGIVPSPDQVSGIKFLVSQSAGNGMEPKDVAVIDAATWVNLKSREDAGVSGVDADTERLALQQLVEKNLSDKARSVLSIAYPPGDFNVAATVSFDYNKVMTESKEYQPSQDSANNTGVLEHQDKEINTSANSLAQGVAGEENNTDATVPDYLADDGTGTAGTGSFKNSQDFAVSYVLNQIEKNNAELVDASMAIMVRVQDQMTPATKQALLENVSKATGIAEENLSIQSVPTAVPEQTATPAGQADMRLIFLIGGGMALLVLLLILLLILAGRSKKKKKKKKGQEDEPEEETPPPFDPEAEQRKEQAELDAHKRQLMEAAKAVKKDDAITVEVREFADTNPEITASLLRAWLKEEEE